MTKSISLSTATAAALVAMTLAAQPAFAQGAPAQPAADASATSDDALGMITVTAQRRVENQKDVPVSVATLSGDVLAAATGAGADIRSLAGRVPSLNIESSFGRTFPRFYIRGLGNTDFDLNASQPVSLVYDDVVLENPILKGFPVFDVKSVEVLRGPQGTLFGRNTPAGIVKFDTVRPDANGQNYGKVSWGTYNTVNAEGAFGGEISDKIALRASVLYQHRDNWVDNVATPAAHDLEGFDDFAARAQLQLKPTEDFTIRLTGQYRNLDGTARVFRANAFAKGSNQLVGLGGAGTKFERDKVWTDGLNFQKLKTYNGTLSLDFDAGPMTISSVTSYWNGNLKSRGDVDGGFGNQFSPVMGPGFIPFSAQSQDDIPSLDQFTQEVRFASNAKTGFGYQFGVFYFHENLDITSYDFANPTDTAPDAIGTQRQVSEALGGFASLYYQFDNGAKVQGGMRLNNDHRRMAAERPLDTRPGFLGFGGPVPVQRAVVDDAVVTWDLSAVYPLSADVNLFARVAKGYRAPSIQGRLVFGRTLSVADSEIVYSYEAGLKSELFDGRARLNLTGFYFDAKNLQLTAVGGASNFTTLINAKKVEGYGFEAELEAKPVRGLTLTAGVSYNHNEIKDPNLFVAGCGGGCTVLDPERAGSPGIYAIDGNQLPQSPRWTANWTAGYAVPVGGGEVYAFTDWAWRSKVQFFLYRSVEFSDDRMIDGGLRIGYRTDRFDIAGFARNITNDVSPVSGIDFNNLTAMVNEPRIFGVEVGVHF